jgi:hypothetical protein
MPETVEVDVVQIARMSAALEKFAQGILGFEATVDSLTNHAIMCRDALADLKALDGVQPTVASLAVYEAQMVGMREKLAALGVTV